MNFLRRDQGEEEEEHDNRWRAGARKIRVDSQGRLRSVNSGQDGIVLPKKSWGV